MRVSGFDLLPSVEYPAPSASDRSFEIRPLGRDRYRLALAGRFGWRWADALFRGLASAGLDVGRGFATRGSEGAWHAAFDLRRTAGGRDPLALDYLTLAGRPPCNATCGFELGHYTLSESSRHGGSLLLDVVGPDRVGFLGGLLERLAFLSLAPVEMRIWTDEQGVEDRFYVKDARGHVPTPRAAKLLGEVLDGRLLR